MHAVPDLAPFSTAQALELGWSRSALARAARTDRIARIRRSQYSPSHASDAVRAVAAARACRGSTISHKSAAVLSTVPLLEAPGFRPDLTLSPPSTGDTVDALVHRATLRPQDIVLLPNGIAMTSPARTVIDLARSCSLRTAVVAIDHVLQHEMTSRDELADVLDMCRCWPGIKRARIAVERSDARSESPLESVSRLALHDLPLPPPEPQVTILDRYGRAVGRLDFYWDEFGVGGEADGRSKYADRDVLNAEKDRHEDIEDLRVELARWQWRHVDHPAALRGKVERAIARARAHDLAGNERLWTPVPSTCRP